MGKGKILTQLSQQFQKKTKDSMKGKEKIKKKQKEPYQN